MHITMLMPNLPPFVCGVADHGIMLGEALGRLGVNINYLGLRGGTGSSDASTMELWDGSTNSLESALRGMSSDFLWVQYSGYGFSRRGVPISLVQTLAGIRKRRPDLRIVVCMHETHASSAGLRWRTPFIQPLQIFAGKRTAQAAHILFATVEKNLLRCVREYGVPAKRVSLLPIASNIPGVAVDSGERVAFRKQLNLHDNARIAVIFGTWATQERTLRLFREDLKLSLENAQIDHVLAIGGDHACCRKEILGALGKQLGKHFTVRGPASREEIGRTLGCCNVGLVPTPLDYLRKSGVVAAFSAAKLELWQKDGGAGTAILRDVEPFPSWEQVANTAMNQLVACTSDRELVDS